MQAVLPGRPQSTLQAVDTVFWEGRRLVVYISRNALIILGGPQQLLQTITHHEDDNLAAVAVDPATGKIAVASNTSVRVYKPSGQEYDALQWSLQCEITPKTDDDAVTCLSWGLPNELLMGGSYLTLTATSDPLHEFWTRRLASPVKSALFSHDSGLIATTAHHDRLVKIWRRSFGGDNERLDTAYLPHPATVTSIEWRGRPDQESHPKSVLYTACADGKLRVWTDTDHHCVSIMSLWCDIDLRACIQPRTTSAVHEDIRRFFFFIESWDFQKLVDQAVIHNQGGDREQQLRHHLREVADKDAEICVIVDDRGHLSAWGIERIGHKARQPNDVLNIAYAENVHLGIPFAEIPEDGNAILRGFISKEARHLNVLSHSYLGKIDWYSGLIDCLFDPASVDGRVQFEGSLTGHSSAVEQLIVDDRGTKVLALTRETEAVVWKVVGEGSETLARACLVNLQRRALSAKFVVKGEQAHFVHANGMSKWDITSLHGNLISVDEVVNGEHSLEVFAQSPAGDELSTMYANAPSGEFRASVPAGRTTVSIWNIKSEALEARKTLKSHETVQSLVWTSVGPSLHVLAVTVPHKVLIFGQNRLSQSSPFSSWLQLREIDVSVDSMLPISTLAWLPTGHIVLAAGNQIFIYDRSCAPVNKSTTRTAPKHDMKELVVRLNASQASFEPQVLSHLVNNGRFGVAARILSALEDRLKFYSEGELIDHLLGLNIEEQKPPTDGPVQNGLNGHAAFAHNTIVEDEQWVDESTSDSLLDSLSRTAVPGLSEKTQVELVNVVRTLRLVASHSASLDDLASTCFFDFQGQIAVNRDDDLANSLTFRPCLQALYSTTQEALLNLATSDHANLPWHAARAAGIPYWLTSLDALRQIFESIGRAEYNKTEDRNPVGCALYYLALRKKTALLGLWRLASGNKERSATMKILANDFEDARWKTVALKNGYALLGKRRAEYAAAWFVLGGALKEAVNVLEERVGDLCLAVAVARVYEGDNGPVLRQLITEKVIPKMSKERNFWAVAWGWSMLGDNGKMLQVLARGSKGLDAEAEDQTWAKEDPSRAATYAMLRDVLAKDPREKSEGVGRAEELELVRSCSYMYRRMGCDVVALELVRRWKFAEHERVKEASLDDSASNGGIWSESQSEEEDVQAYHERKSVVDSQPRKVVTAEPSAASILDSFDF